MKSPCAHLDGMIAPDAPLELVCEECVEAGEDWVHLRQCMTCGHVGCCDDSKNRHATKHFNATDHPIVKSMEQGWLWCYIDRVIV
ncbi:MAG: UBP-type zinc finger domain-containing protein [Nitrospiraceae bacterium]|nr:UBP-type zinc finger domain-containing protein [Nitrospiraceae bacterium]